MFAIVATLLNSFFRLLSYFGLAFQWLAYWFMQLWSAALAVLQAVINVAASMIAFTLTMVTDAFILLLTVAAAVLPNMPAASIPSGGIDLVSLNRYLPMGEVFSFGTVWGVVFGAIGLYKLAKFIRGAG